MCGVFLCRQVFIFKRNTSECRTLLKAWDDWPARERGENGFELTSTMQASYLHRPVLPYVGGSFVFAHHCSWFFKPCKPCARAEQQGVFTDTFLCQMLYSLLCSQTLLRDAPPPPAVEDPAAKMLEELGKLQQQSVRSINGLLEYMQSGANCGSRLLFRHALIPQTSCW